MRRGPDHQRRRAEREGAGDHLEPAGRAVAAARGEPGGQHEVADDESAERRSRHRLPERLEDRSGDAENEHRAEEQGAGAGVQPAALARRDRDRAGGQGEQPARDMDRHQDVHAASRRAASSGRYSRMSPGWQAKARADRLERREADRARLAGLEDRQVDDGDSDPLGELGQRHPAGVEQIVELDGDRHVTPSLRDRRASARPRRRCGRG